MRLSVHAALTSERTAVGRLLVAELVLVGRMVGALVVGVTIGVGRVVARVRLLVHCCTRGSRGSLAVRRSRGVVA